MTSNVQGFGAIGNGQFDDGPAIRAALASGEPVYLPAGTYRVVGDIVVESAAHIFGDGGAFRHDRSRIRFEGGGIVIASNNGDAAQPSGVGTRITDLCIQGDPSHAQPLVSMRAAAAIERCYLLDSGGAAVYIDGLASSQHNANGWNVSHVWIEDCAGWGIETHGSDAQAAVASDIHVVACGGGIYDGSFLGSTWVGCHVEYCSTLGGYLCDGSAARALFIGCYCESDSWAMSWVTRPAIVIGGTLAAAVRAMPVFDWTRGQHRASWRDDIYSSGQTWESASGSRKITAALGMPADGRTVLSWQDRSQSNGDPHDFALMSDDATKAYWIARGRSANLTPLGWTRVGHALGYDQLLAPNGVHLGRIAGRRVSYADSMPDASHGATGDVVLATIPTETLDGWRKTVSGWRAFAWSAGV